MYIREEIGEEVRESYIDLVQPSLDVTHNLDMDIEENLPIQGNKVQQSTEDQNNSAQKPLTSNIKTKF